MSTDAYIDFHSRESWVLESQNDWQSWDAFLEKMTLPEQEKHYDPYRVGYVFNFFMGCNSESFDKMVNELRGAMVDDILISDLLKRWTTIYNLAQNPPSGYDNDNAFCRDDLITLEELKDALEAHRGYFIRFRVD